MLAAGTHRRVLSVVLAGYLAAVARITLWPEPADEGTFGVVRRVIAALAGHGLPLTYAGVEAGANVLMFVPFGVLVPLVVPLPDRWRRWRRWRWLLVVAAGLLTSAAIELSQLLFLPTRYATVQDVALNTLGAALGALAVRLVLRYGWCCGPASGIGHPSRAGRARPGGGDRLR